MINQTFDFKRFCTYFKYDIKQMWRNHSVAAILIGASGLIAYVAWVLLSLVFNQTWVSPTLPVRIVVFLIAFTILEFYQTRTYGYLTEKQAGSSFLMLPASTTEKFVSMLIMTTLIIPFLFIVVFFAIDSLLALLDPTMDTALITGLGSGLNSIFETLGENGSSPIIIVPGAFVVSCIMSIFCNFLYFLLCGICFRKNKIGKGIAIIVGISFLSSLIMGFFAPSIAENMEMWNPGPDELVAFANRFYYIMMGVTLLIIFGLGWGVYRRIKTLKH